ncbi:MAG: 50S ribosomal protein L13 [Proteobacteria bacterium]|nr:MAG: 50S ribosomal protein L13 [Pseudomonadota bacterium]
MKTVFPSTKEAQDKRSWVLVDASDQPVGRVASKVAAVLRGKNKVYFSPHVNAGDHVVVVNAAKIRFTGKKLVNKVYRDYTGYIGGLKEIRADDLLEKKPEEVIMRAVQGMLPGGPLGRAMLRKLRVYKGTEHPHKAQIGASAGAGQP